MKTIKITKATVCGGKDVKPGDVVKASPTDANILLQMGKAEEHKTEAAAPEVTEEKPKATKRTTKKTRSKAKAD